MVKDMPHSYLARIRRGVKLRKGESPLVPHDDRHIEILTLLWHSGHNAACKERIIANSLGICDWYLDDVQI